MRILVCAFLSILTLFLSNGYAQEYTTWGLPDGAKARLGKGEITTIAFSPNGTELAVASSIGIWIYDVQTGKELALLPGYREKFTTSVISTFDAPFTVHKLAFSPNGELLACASTDETIRIFDVSTYTERYTLATNKEGNVNNFSGPRIRDLAFSSDGKSLTVLEGAPEYRIKVWDMNSGNLLSDVSGRIGGPPLKEDAQFSQSGVRVSTDSVKQKHQPLVAVILSPDGTTFAAVNTNITIIDGESEAAIRLGDVHTGKLRPTHMYIFGQNADQSAPPDLETATTVASVPVPLEGLGFSPDGTILVGLIVKTSSTRDPKTKRRIEKTEYRKLRFWEVSTGRELPALIPEHELGEIHSFRFSPDGKMFVTLSKDKGFQLWNTRTGNLISSFTISPPEFSSPSNSEIIGSGDFSPDGKTLAFVPSGKDAEIQLWDMNTGKIKSTLTEHPIVEIRYVADKTFLSTNNRGTVFKIREKNTGQVQLDVTETWEKLTTHVDTITKLNVTAGAISLIGPTLAIGNKDGSLWLWDGSTNQLGALSTEHTDEISVIAFTKDGKSLASSSKDNSIRLWDIQTRKVLIPLTEHKASANSLVFSPDGTMLAGAIPAGTIWLWELNTGRLISKLTAHETYVPNYWKNDDYHQMRLVFSADSKHFASSSIDGMVILWDVGPDPRPLTLPGHKRAVEALAFSPDGKLLASGSQDKTIRLWSVEKEVELAIFRGHAGGVNSLTFSADGSTLVSGSIDGTILLWDRNKIVDMDQ
ncbi:MAG: WD40 repeat domain-containing protein [Candidatus Poribacteria bacterium]|nr:WD40 repeat domain-containing protein [Candidatus Poribacteria bacterium]